MTIKSHSKENSIVCQLWRNFISQLGPKIKQNHHGDFYFYLTFFFYYEEDQLRNNDSVVVWKHEADSDWFI